MPGYFIKKVQPRFHEETALFLSASVFFQIEFVQPVIYHFLNFESFVKYSCRKDYYLCLSYKGINKCKYKTSKNKFCLW